LLRKRIIPCLDIKDGKVVKGVNFVNLRIAGDPVELARQYYEYDADELVFLDISATIEKRKTLAFLVEKIAKVIRIPFTVGGGISKLDDIEKILKSGADKVSLNSAIVKNPKLIYNAAKIFGSQAIVAAIDTKRYNNKHTVYVKGGTVPTDLETTEWCKKVEELGAGEILLTSMDADGTKSGYDIELLQYLSANLTIPIIASGGAGSMKHFLEAFEKTNVDACLAASVFHNGEIKIKELKKYLAKNNINVRI